MPLVVRRCPYACQAFLAAALACCGLTTALAEPNAAFTDEQLQFFERDVAPILKANCLQCHGAETKIQGGLRLTSREDVLKGGENGPVVSLDSPTDSSLLEAINYQSFEMPPKGKLPRTQIDVLTRWVKMGLPWPEGERGTLVHRGPPVVDERARQFWSFRPVVRPAVPTVKDQSWVRNPIDAFVLAKLEEKGLRPAPPAERAALMRRLNYTLTGLPPTGEVLKSLTTTVAPSPPLPLSPSRNEGARGREGEWERDYLERVEKLLASRYYGEHWGRHWLDLVRYAETNSFERDNPKPFVWRYRDYVIRALNSDKPYDQFVREQLAGDELEEVTADTIIATGYYRLGLWDDEPADPLLSYYDGLDDIVATTGQAILGLTVNCARCHDHKIDPFPQRDYYRLLAFFHGIRHYGDRSDESVTKASLLSIATPAQEAEHREVVKAYNDRVAALDAELRAIDEPIQDKLPGGERDDFKHPRSRLAILRKHIGNLLTQEQFDRYASLRREADRLQRERPKAAEQALAVKEHEQPRETFVLLRGNPQSHGDRVEPGFPALLTPAGAGDPSLMPPPAGRETSFRRRALADWIVSPNNPLTSRVIVNRVWQYHFGRGIVRSSSNFGYQGTPPTHPELLDWLADWFTHDAGWSLKKLHRLILTSNTYQQGSGFRVQGSEAADSRNPNPEPRTLNPDPENDLLSHFDLRRLTAEEVRDSILAVCGNLNLEKKAGPSIYPPISPEVLAGQSRPGYGWSTSSPRDASARSVFVHIKRSLALPILATFDAPDPDAPCPVRFATTQPTQALAMLNSEFLNSQAGVLARLAADKSGDKPTQQVEFVLQRVLQRTPTAGEIDRGVRFLATARASESLSTEESLRQYCLLALNLNEFLYLE